MSRIKENFYYVMKTITVGKTQRFYAKKYKKSCAMRPLRLFEFNDRTRHYLNDLMMHVQLYQRAARLHPDSFSGYKNKYVGRDVCLIGCGPTLNYYKSVDDAVYVGVNRAFKHDKIKLDYIFVEDYNAEMFQGLEEYYKTNKKVKRFYGIHQRHFIGNAGCISESVAIRHNAARFYTRVRTKHPVHENYIQNEEFALDITAEPLTCSGSVIFPALQFILYTNPRRIFVYGCDCYAGTHFYSNDNAGGDATWRNAIEGWHKLKEFISVFYPETEVISVNPIGLRGLFRDVYTEGFLAQYPEIDRNSVEILK